MLTVSPCLIRMLHSDNRIYMNNLKVLSLIICIIGLSTGCSKKGSCVDTDITSSIINIANYCDDPALNMQLITNDQFSIIRNIREYDDKIVGACHPDIDFTQLQLIVGHFYSQKKILKFNYKLYLSTEPNYYKLAVTPQYASTELNNQTVAYYYQILVPQKEQIEVLKVIYIDKNS